MVRALSFFIRYFSNYYTLHRSDLAARAAPLDPHLCIKYSKLLILSKSFDFSNSSFFPCLFCIHSTSIHYMNEPFIFFCMSPHCVVCNFHFIIRITRGNFHQPVNWNICSKQNSLFQHTMKTILKGKKMWFLWVISE